VTARRYKVYLVLTVLVAFGSLGGVIATGASPKLGLDLEGGISVILTAQGDFDQDVLDKTVEVIRQRIDALGVSEPEVTSSEGGNVLIQLPGVENEEEALDLINTTAQLTFRQVEEVIPANAPAKDRPEITDPGEIGAEVKDQEVVYPSGQQDETGVLYRLKAATLTGDVIDSAEAVPEPNNPNFWVVSISMNDEGDAVWADFTSDLACLRDEGEEIKSQVAIELDGKVESAAGMQAPGGAAGGGVTCGEGITGGDTQIDVGDQGEAKDLALVLRYGALPLTLEQQETRKVSPTLGRDSLNAGLTAGALGLGLVLIYVVLYYRGLGFIVWLGLTVFSAIMYSIMAVLGETAGLSLSLAGIAGVIVSIGVTCDSYIVAFERLNDEMAAGKSLRAAAERGMARALRTILVADFVTASAAVILFYLAVGPVKGFALTLGLATMVDLVIAYFFTRPMVNLLARTKFFSEGRFFGIKRALGAQA